MSTILPLYKETVDNLIKAVEALEKKSSQLSNVRLIVFALGALMGMSIFATNQKFLFLTFIPFVIFIFLIRKHQEVLDDLTAKKALLAFYQQGLNRLANDWQGKGFGGENFKDDEHLFSNDLDLFGEGSLFEYLCVTQSNYGAKRLADFLLNEDEQAHIEQRQREVQVLTPLTELREKLLATPIAEVRNLAEFKSWSLDAVKLPLAMIRFWALLSGLAALTFTGMWFVGQLSLLPLLGVFAANVFLSQIFGKRSTIILEGTEDLERQVKLLAHSLGCLEECDGLGDLQKRCHADGFSVSKEILKLNEILSSLEQLRSNAAMSVFNILFLITLRNVAKLERWRHQYGQYIKEWADVAAEFEALASLATYAYEHPNYVYPQFSSTREFDAKGLGHPLLAPEAVKCNDLHFGEYLPLVMISGSNMAGKSTFLRTIGVNAILAQAGAPVFADKLSLALFRPACSINISDSLQHGISHFYAEVLRLKKIIELAKTSKRPVLYFFDEILHGTNSYDRRIGAEGIIELLLEYGATGLVTTHDLTLAKIVDDLPSEARNIHFSEFYRDGEMHFDYQIKDGIAGKGNAVELIRAQGIPIRRSKK